MLVGGFPCPDWSGAGARRGADGQDGDLGYLAVLLAVFLQVTLAGFENVPGILDHPISLGEMFQPAVDAGYQFVTRQSPSTPWAPQHRPRVFLILFHPEAGVSPADLHEYKHRRTQGKALAIRDLGLPYSPPPPDCPSWWSAHDRQVLLSPARTNGRRVLLPDCPAPTVLHSYGTAQTSSTFDIVHGFGFLQLCAHRFLTVAELKVVMGFPRGFRLPNHRASYGLLGNAVIPAQAAAEVGRALYLIRWVHHPLAAANELLR